MSVIEAVTSRVWAITPEYLQIILKIANREATIEAINTLHKERSPGMDGTKSVLQRGNVAILPVRGPIMKYANLFSNISGATSLQLLMLDFNAALNNPEVDSIILEIDSPGGEANGVNEFAEFIYKSRDQKKIIAYVGGFGASAAYWIASAASEIVIDKTAMVGSIGVVASYIDDSEKLAKEGIKEIEIVSATSPNKRPNLNTDEGRAQIQRRVDALQEVFVAAVARNREADIETVLSDFGQGDVRIGEEAVKFNMADRLGSLESVIEEHTNPKTEVFSMSEEQVKTYRAEEITTDLLKKEFPEVAKALSEEGKLTERIRIKEIDSLSRPGFEGLIHEAMFESDDSAADVALRILEEEKKRTAALKGEVTADATEIPNLHANPEESEDAERQTAVAAMAKGINQNSN